MRLISTTAITASSTPTAMEPMASGVGEPVIWCRKMPVKAISRPISAAASSKKTARRVGLEVVSTYAKWRRRKRPAFCRVCRNA